MAKFLREGKRRKKKKEGEYHHFRGFFALPDLPIYGVLDDDGSVATWRTESALLIYSTFSSMISGGK